MNRYQGVSGVKERNDLVVLTEAERSALSALADQLTNVLPALVDRPQWMGAARGKSCHLPARLGVALRQFRGDPGPGGVLHVSGLPAEGTRPTPVERGSVERRATAPAAALMLCGMALGEIVSFRPEKSGAAVQNVVPVPGYENSQSNAGSSVLTLHVENAFHPFRPDYVLLSCLRSDHDGIAGLQLACIRHALPLLMDDDRAVLAEPRFRTDPPPSFNGTGVPAVHAILTGAADDPDIRVDFNSTVPLDGRAAAAMSRFGEAMTAVATTVRLTAGDLVIVDNRLAVHGRTAFSPRYDGRDRWLHRIFVHLDGRRSRGSRTGGDHVLD